MIPTSPCSQVSDDVAALLAREKAYSDSFKDDVSHARLPEHSARSQPTPLVHWRLENCTRWQ